MAVDPRIQALLERWPDDLSDEEIAELRAAAEADPEVDEVLAAMVEAVALMVGASESPTLSEPGRARLDHLLDEVRNWSTGGATPSGRADVDEAKGWSTGGATPSGKVVDLGQARRRRELGAATWLAIAAAVAIASGLLFGRFGPDTPTGPDDDRFGYKDDDTTDRPRIDGQLWVMGEERVQGGEARPVAAAVTFRAVLERDASLVLLETQGDATWVVYPLPGESWTVPAGTHLLQPPGASAEFTPSKPGPATYTLVASHPTDPIAVPRSRQVPSVEALIERPGATYVLESVKIVWEEVD